MFGIGGAGATTPSIRVFLGASPAIALGTTLPVTIPTAAAGGYTYYRRGLVAKRVALFAGLTGLLGAVGGALLTWVIDLHYLMLATGALVLYVAVSTLRRGFGGGTREPVASGAADSLAGEEDGEARESPGLAMGIGLAAGLFSGLLGVGGGIVLVPGFIYILKLPLKKAFGTSLVVIAAIAVPGSIVHALLGHVSWELAFFLMVGSIPGAYIGARITMRTTERVLYALFGLLIALLGVVFIVNEIMVMID